MWELLHRQVAGRAGPGLQKCPGADRGPWPSWLPPAWLRLCPAGTQRPPQCRQNPDSQALGWVLSSARTIPPNRRRDQRGCVLCVSLPVRCKLGNVSKVALLAGPDPRCKAWRGGRQVSGLGVLAGRQGRAPDPGEGQGHFREALQRKCPPRSVYPELSGRAGGVEEYMRSR